MNVGIELRVRGQLVNVRVAAGAARVRAEEMYARQLIARSEYERFEDELRAAREVELLFSDDA